MAKVEQGRAQGRMGGAAGATQHGLIFAPPLPPPGPGRGGRALPSALIIQAFINSAALSH